MKEDRKNWWHYNEIEVQWLLPNSSSRLYLQAEQTLHQSTAASTPFGLGRLLAFRGSKLPRALPSHKPFFRRAALWVTAEEQHAASLKSVAYLLSSPVSLLSVFVSSFVSFYWWATTFILTLVPFFPVECALEIWPGGVQCSAAPALNESI